MKKIIALSAVLVMGALGMACGESAANNANAKVANAMNAAANAANTAANAAANAANQAATAANTVSNAVSNMKPATNAPANSISQTSLPERAQKFESTAEVD